MEGRRRLRVVVVVAACLMTVGAMWAVVRSPVLDVDHVRVEGAALSGRDAVIAASGVRRGNAMGGIEEAAGARRVEALPWVSRAVVSRQWPGTVVIRVVERVAVAVTRDVSGSWAVLDVSGRVLAWVADRPGGLPELAGVPLAGAPGTRTDPAVAGLLAVAQSVPVTLFPRLAAITARGAEVDLQLLPQGTARLGPPEGAPDRIRVVEEIVSRVEPAALATIDARFPSTAVLTRR